MKRFAVISLLALTVVAASWAQSLPRFDLTIQGGYGLTSLKGISDYADTWSYIYLANVHETAAIDAKSKAGIFFGGGLAYYFTPNIGVGLNFGYIKGKVDTTSAADFNWKWSTSSTQYNRTLDYVGTDNSIQTMPLSLNLIGRFGGERFQGFVQAGPTMFFNKVMLDSAILYGVSSYYITYIIYPIWYTETQYVDALTIPIEINQSWTGFGADFGAGFNFWFTPSFGLTVDARYFFCPKKTLDWSFITGQYNGTFFTNITNVTFSQDDIDWMYENADTPLTTIDINPSFFQIGIGIKIRLY